MRYVVYTALSATVALFALLGLVFKPFSPSVCGREVRDDWTPEEQFIQQFKNLQCVERIRGLPISFDDIFLNGGGGVKICVDDLGNHDRRICPVRVMRTQIDLLQLEVFETTLDTSQPAVTLGWRKVGSVGDPASTAKLVYTMFQ